MEVKTAIAIDSRWLEVDEEKERFGSRYMPVHSFGIQVDSHCRRAGRLSSLLGLNGIQTNKPSCDPRKRSSL